METNNMNTNNNELNNDKLVGVFQTEQQASQAIEELKASGINKDNISVIAKDKKDLKHISEETGTKAPEGIATGAAAGGTIGGVAGLLAGIGMMAIPVFGPIMAAGPIAVTLAGAAAGAAGGGLVGGLIGLGIPEDQAKEYENNVKEGQILVLVDEQTGRQKTVYDIFRKNQASNTKYYDTDTTATATSVPTATTEHEVTAENVGNGRFDLGEDEQTLRLREEQLNVSKTRAQTGEVEVHKEVIEEQKVVNVPVSHEEVVVERKAVNNEATSEPIGSGEAIRVPVTEEQVEVNKRNVVTGEVEVHKQTVQGTEQVQDTVKHEEARVTRNGEPIVNEGRIGEERNTLNLPKK